MIPEAIEFRPRVAQDVHGKVDRVQLAQESLRPATTLVAP